MPSNLMKNFFIRYVPTRFYLAMKRIALRLSEARAARRDGRNPLIPPANKTFVYGVDQDFTVMGAEFLKHFIALGGLKPDHRALDIGCGIGRIAMSLTGYLAGGEYRGFDIIGDGIAWCRDNITPRHPNFRFEAVDIYNKTYNPGGRLAAAEFKFPYPDAYFDFVYTTSVFTHMLPADLENYLAESARVMKRGARSMHTFFLVNEESAALAAKGIAAFDFAYRLDGCLAVSRIEPEKAVAYEETRVRELYAKCGLTILEPVRYGNWCGRSEYLSGQDIIIAEKI